MEYEMRRSSMQRSSLFSRLLFCGVAGAMTLSFVAVPLTAQQSAGAFTAEQASNGEAVYSQNCAGCHGVNLEGSGDAPALVGGTFLLKWRPKMVSVLFGDILQTMPASNPGSLGEAAALNATAYILERNGAATGQQALSPGATTLISAIATGRAPANGGRNGGGAASLVAGAGSAAGASGQRNVPVVRRGVTVAGEVKNYVPVTPEMLRNPPPGDWLIFGRNYQRQSYSPLNQITRDNVKELQLKWTWAINDSGANQTTPIVHNGIIYLASPSNIVQALDGKTGDLIWETRVGPDQAPGYGGIRSIAIAEDKIFLPTSDAHMVALDARDGKILWDTPASDKPHVSTSGD